MSRESLYRFSVLALPDLAKMFTFYKDASDRALRVVLAQERKTGKKGQSPVSYAVSLHRSEMTPFGKKDYCRLVWGIKQLHSYLRSAPYNGTHG